MTEGQLDHITRRSGQAHLSALVANWSEEAKAALLKRLQEVDWEELAAGHEETLPTSIEPSRVVSLSERNKRAGEFRAAGEQAYKRGEVAVLMVAGGQGTRLGSSSPKGCYPVGALSKKSIYQYHAERFVQLSSMSSTKPLFLIMTSPATDTETKEFFASNGNFSIPAEQLQFFQQGTVPSLDLHGRAVLAGEGALLENPDGHGGCFTALVQQGILEKLHTKGVKHILYIQVDNILAPMYDPELIGLAVTERADVITKVVEKTNPAEKVGLLVKADGQDYLLEYIHLSPEQAQSRAEDGGLTLRWGNTAMHYWSVDFFWQKAEEKFRLPLHRSKKPLKAWTPEGGMDIEGYKHERFIFDLLPVAKTSIGLEVLREQEFAPLKNADGADSLATVHELSRSLYVSWLEKAGVKVRPGVNVEISPLYAADEQSFLKRWDNSTKEVTEDLFLDGA